jgi:branched-chain amino acid transport system substrate-binding protein
MNKKLIWGVVVVIVLIIIVVAVGKKATHTSDSTTFKIGVISPLTGWGAYWGEGYNKGVNLAVSDIQSRGGKVEAMIEDGGTDAQKSASAAQKLLSIDRVDGLTVEFAGPSSATSPIALQNKVPLVYDAIVKKFVEQNPYAFKFYFDVSKQCYEAAKYLAAHGSKNIGGFSVNIDFAPECETALTKAAQESGVKSKMYLFNEDTTDFRTIFAKMKADGVDSIVPVFYEDHAISFFKQKNDLKWNIPVFMGIGIPDGFTEKVRSSVPATSIEGVITYDQPIDPTFKDKLLAKYPDALEKEFTAAAYGYDEVTYLYDGLSKCEKGKVDCVVDAMKKDTRRGVLGSAGFGEDRILDMNPLYYKYTYGKLIEFDPNK